MRYKVITLLIFIYSAANAILPEEALKLAYKNDSGFTKLKIAYLKNIESFPSSLARHFVPEVSLRSRASLDSSKGDYQPFSRRDGIVFKQEIFSSGGGIAALKHAKNFAYYSEIELFLKAHDLLVKDLELFLETYAAQESYKASEATLKFAQNHYNYSQKLYDLGSLTKSEVVSAKSEMTYAKYQKLKYYSELQEKKGSFKKQFGVEPELLELQSLNEAKLKVNAEEYKNLFLQNSLEVAHAEAALQMSKANIWNNASKILPRAYLESEIYRNHGKDSFMGPKKNGFSTEIVIEVPLVPTNSGSYSEIRKAKLEMREAAVNREYIIKTAQLTAKNIWEKYKTSVEAWNSAQDAVEATELLRDVTEKEYKLGSQDFLKVLETEHKLYQAKLKLIKAKIEYFSIYYQAKLLLGKNSLTELGVLADFDPRYEFQKVKLKIIGL